MPTQEELDAWQAEAQALDIAGITEDEAREAIDGYLQAALFAAPNGDLSGRGLSWSAEAQSQARRDVIHFITDNVLVCTDWRQQTGHDWMQIGIDLLFTRNREGAGFWSRDGAGAVGDTLTDLAHAYPEVRVIVDDNGELSFEEG